MKLTSRLRNIISGLCALVLLTGTATLGVQYSFGAFDRGYELYADFGAAGQGLIEESDIKMRGIDIGRVEGIELIDGRARVTLFIEGDRRIPTTAEAVIRPKTLFGEKFVDIVPGEGEGGDDFLEPGSEIENTTDGIELEAVLRELYPVLAAVDPAEVAVILDTLAAAGDDLGETINRSIENGNRVLAVTAARDAETRQFLEDLAALSDELAVRAPDLVAGAADLNVALPVLTRNREAFTALLEQTERVSAELADLLEGNTAFIDSVYTDGQATLDVLFANRSQLLPLVIGLRQYAEVLASAARIPVGDGTVMAAVKGILGGDVCDLVITCDTGQPTATAGAEPPATSTGSTVAPPLVPDLLDATQRATVEIHDLLDQVTGGLIGGGG